MKKAGIVKKIAILVIVLALPGFLYYLLVAEGKNRYLPLPIFGPRYPAKTSHLVNGKNVPDTIYHTLPDFRLTDQDDKPVSPKTFDDKIFVVNFFYTRCPGVCMQMNNNMNLLATSYAANKMVYFVTVTVDPAHDSVPVLKNYADSFKPLPPKWLFLTGDTSDIYNLARKGLLVNALQRSKDDFVYSEKMVLIDENKRIRGYYTGAAVDEASRLNDEIKVLIAEQLRKKDAPLY
jgi:protein SCO1/2